MMRFHPSVTMRVGVIVAVLVGTMGTAHASVLCARVRGDGSRSGSVKIRDVCRGREVQLAPQDVGFCCETASTTSTTGPSPTSTTPTATTAPTPTTMPSTTTTTIAAVCGNNVIEGDEVCDCGIPPCTPVRYGVGTLNHGGCPNGSDASSMYCASDCSTCLPAPRCGNGILEPGDTCDWEGGSNGDNCAPGSICQDTVPCECTCAGAGGFCFQQTPCCSGLTCVNSVCQ